MKNIFGNFDLVPQNEKGYVEELEKEFNISLPPVFKTFCKTFILNSLKPDEGHHIFHPDENLAFDEIKYDLRNLMKSYLNESDYIKKFEMFKFATSQIHSGGILISLRGKNIDKVFVDIENESGRFRFVAESIFDFITQIQQYDYSNE